MSLSRKHLAVALLALIVSCAESPTEPGELHPLPAIRPHLVLPPGTTPASFGLVIDTVGIYIAQVDTSCSECDISESGRPLLVRPTARMLDTTYIDTLMAWPANQESFTFRYEIPPPDSGFAIEVYLYYYSGQSLIFYGSDLVEFERGNIHLPPIDMYYNGPGYNADDIQMAPGDTAMAPGDTLQFVATAYNNGLPLDTVYISWRVSDSAAAKIDHLGRLTLRNGATGSSFLVSAAIPNGAITTTRVSAPNTVTSLVKVAGDSQSAALGDRTSLPLVVRARDVNNKPVPGARIRFRYLSGPGASLPDSIVFADPQGLARSGPIPTTGAGVDSIRAEVTAATTVNANFRLTATAAAARAFLFTADSGGSGQQLYRADSAGGNRITLGYPAAAVSVAGPRWNPARNRVVYTSYNANAGIYQLLLTTAIGDTTAVLVTDSNSSGGRFSPTGKYLAFICHGTAYDFSGGGVCTINAVDGALGPLNGAGDGAGRTDLSGLVPGRPYGTASFAWRPDASTRIAFSRDTILDTLTSRYASRIYSTNGDGTGLTPLSPRVADLGRGPLLILSGMDWSPDGTTIVFTATDNSTTEAALYALDVASGGVRRLTTPTLGWTGDFYPKFSPDGTRILFQRINYYYCCGMVTDFYSVHLTGGGPTRLTYEGGNWPGPSYDPYSLGGDWSPNGLSVLVTAENGQGNRAAYKVPIDVTSQADYFTRRVLVGTAGIAVLTDYQVSWLP